MQGVIDGLANLAMDCHYVIIENTYTEASWEVTEYGIACLDGGVSPVLSIPSITVNRGELERILALCNELSLAPEHLEDVICDFLAS